MDAKAKAAPPVGNCNIIHADCMAGMETLPAGSVNLIFADPKYNQGVDYGDGKKADQLTDKKYLEEVEAWVDQCHRILAADGTLWVLISDAYAAEFSTILKKQFTRRSWIKWYETFGMNVADGFSRTTRHLFYCVKNPDQFTFHREPFTRLSDRQAKYHDRRADPAGKIWDDMWDIPRLVDNCKERIPGVPTQLPLALVAPIVQGCSNPGDRVFDPFVGSGTTAVAAITSGRDFIGTEIKKRFAEIAMERVRMAAADKKANT